MKAGISGEKRRGEILKLLSAASGPVSAAVLAEKLSVSRQIIVGDISLLRAGGENILSTPRGYLMERPSAGLIKTVVCLHRGEDMEKELNIMVDNGCQVLDVVVDHPIYGQLSGRLLLSTRSDVEKFVCDVQSSRPLPSPVSPANPYSHVKLSRSVLLRPGPAPTGTGRFSLHQKRLTVFLDIRLRSSIMSA
jgi:transcriptional regulator of NAD metabolism